MDAQEDRLKHRLAAIRQQEEKLDREAAERGSPAGNVVAPIVQRRRSGPLRSFVFMLALFVVAAGLLGLAVTLNRWAGEDMGAGSRPGQALVSACTERGPVTNRGFGYWQSCEARVVWDDGDAEDVTIGAIFTTADVGDTVEVGDLGTHRGDRQLARADEPYRAWLGWLSYAVGAVAVLPGLVWVLLMRQVLSFRRG